jgi:hypothetical protein
MSQRNRVVLSTIALLSLAFLAGCGSSSSPSIAPPSGSFTNADLTGTYVFSLSGTDSLGAPYAIVGSFTASGNGGNGTGTITSGTIDINDADTEIFPDGPIPDSTLGGSSSYTVGVDGRGQAHLVTSTAFGTVVLDFVLQDNTHGLVTEFDENASGSGTIDLQTTGAVPSGSYAYSFTGADSNGDPFANVGNFTFSGGTAVTGLADLNDGFLAYANQSLGGTVVAGPASQPGTGLTASGFGTQIYDVYVIDSTHLKFIEMDGIGTLSGDAFSQTSPTFPTGTLAFTLAGAFPNAETPAATGGFIVTDGNGNITSSSSEDVNDGGTLSPAPLAFTGQYAAAGAGRYTIDNLSGFYGTTASGTTPAYAAYPYNTATGVGVFLLEIDDGGFMVGSTYPPQTSGATLASSQGYGLNLSGANIDEDEAIEVDDIAEFATASSGDTATGKIDENYPGNTDTGASFGSTLDADYTTPSGGRGQIGTTNSINTLNGGFVLTYYAVDGTTFPFIESDNGQIATGVFVEQSPTSASAAVKSHIVVARPLVRAHIGHKNTQKKQK